MTTFRVSRAFPPLVRARCSVTCDMTGRVSDASAAAVPGATITLTNV